MRVHRDGQLWWRLPVEVTWKSPNSWSRTVLISMPDATRWEALSKFCGLVQWSFPAHASTSFRSMSWAWCLSRKAVPILQHCFVNSFTLDCWCHLQPCWASIDLSRHTLDRALVCVWHSWKSERMLQNQGRVLWHMQGSSALMHAAWAGQLDVVQYLLSVGADVAARDNQVNCRSCQHFCLLHKPLLT